MKSITNLEIANIAQDIQTKSTDNVSVNLEFGLNEKIGHRWSVSVHVWNASRSGIIESMVFNPLSTKLEKHRMMMLAKYGYNFK